MQVEVKTFPIDIQITVRNCEELNAVWRLKTSFDNKEVDEVFSKMKKSAMKNKTTLKPKFEWIRRKELRETMRALGVFTTIDLMNAFHMKHTKRNKASMNSKIGKEIRSGNVIHTLQRRKPVGAKRQLKVYAWKE